MTEMRVVTSYVVQRFDMVVAEGFNMDDWERDLQDHFVMKKGCLPIRLSRRE